MDKIKNIFTQKRVAAGAVLVSVAGSANAALPEHVTKAFTSIGTLVTDLEAQAWIIVPLVFVALAGITLFKKFANKAVS
ncbi:TPA: major coat protein [Vibrio vulnificus]